jgi:murein DD-endopeptidase MepM/ murein hydrolase activator NlpD
LVKVGQRVNQGQPIGLEGSTGNSTGPHVHFELRIKNQPVDPTPYLPPGAPSAFKG